MSLDVSLIVPQHNCPACRGTGKADVEVYSANITHNLRGMAIAADIYMHLWRPDEIGITTAGQLIKPISAGLAKLRQDPAHFRTFDSSNGWGTYTDFVPYVTQYLNACLEYPEAEIKVSR